MADGNYSQRFNDRQSPLPWQEERMIVKGAVQLQVTSAVSPRNNKKLYSWSLSRAGADGGRATKHLRLDDLPHVEEALQELRDWVQSQNG